MFSVSTRFEFAELTRRNFVTKELPPKLSPVPQNTKRRQNVVRVRKNAAKLRENFDIPPISNNGELGKYWPEVPSTFSKGLLHDDFGIVKNKADMIAFVDFINQTRDNEKFGNVDTVGKNLKPKGLVWESPLAGHVYDLEGPDAGDVVIPPAPAIADGELAAEMAEVYALALMRDYPFTVIQSGDTPPDATIKAIRKQLPKNSKYTPPSAKIINDAVQDIGWFEAAPANETRAEKRRKARRDSGDSLTPDVLYRGSTPGAKAGPYISQFMLIGNASVDKKKNSVPAYTGAPDSAPHNVCPALDGKGRARKVDEGFIVYGTQEISQKTRSHRIGLDYMTTWADWCSVQNGMNRKDEDEYEAERRFITTPRDLATYVHFDQLYQAYLNACLLMLTFKYPFDPGIPKANTKNRAAFATFGGPHILSLLTEVASRALKHARRQKFNTHLRARPEAISGMLTLAANGRADKLGEAAEADFGAALDQLSTSGILALVNARNDVFNKSPAGNKSFPITDNYLLPMAFPEGSPMHPSYAAGHASVAGACVTILKAFFDMYKTKSGWDERNFSSIYGSKPDQLFEAGFLSGIFVPAEDGLSLRQLPASEVKGTVSIQGELDKLAANISIGRDMAGVHYYTDYYESLRLGERVAVGILQEQMLAYPEPVSMRLHTFDGEQMTIAGKGDGETATVDVPGGYQEWFTRID